MDKKALLDELERQKKLMATPIDRHTANCRDSSPVDVPGVVLIPKFFRDSIQRCTIGGLFVGCCIHRLKNRMNTG